MAQTYWRVDTRDFVPGDHILPEGTYQEAFNEHGRATEDLLEQHRPADKPVRRDALFVFEDRAAALFYASKKSGRRLYQVQIDGERILHRGDMAHTDVIGRHYSDGQLIGTAVADYWAGQVSDKPCIEVLVEECVILTAEAALTDAERSREYLRGVRAGTTHDESQEDFDKRIGF